MRRRPGDWLWASIVIAMASSSSFDLRSRDLPVYSPFRQIDDVGRAHAILNEMQNGMFARAALAVDEILTDDRISGVTETRVAGIQACPLRFEPGTERRQAQKIADMLGGVSARPGMWRWMIPPAQMAELWTWGWYMGFAIAEILWQRLEDAWTPCIRVWHPHHAWWNWSTRRYVLNTTEGQIEMPDPDRGESDGRWFVWTPNGYQYGWRRGLLRSLLLKYISRNWNERDWDRFNELHGQGILVAEVPGNVNEENDERFFASIRDRGSESTVIAPQSTDGKIPGYGIKLVEAMSRTWEGFQQRKRELDNDIAVRLIGQTLTTDTQGAGSRAAVAGHELVRIDKMLMDAELVHALHQQVLVPWALRNWNDPDLAPRPMFEVIPPSDELAEAASLKMLAEAITTLIGFAPNIDTEAMLEEAGIPILSPDEVAAREAEGGENVNGDGFSLTPSAISAIIKVNEARGQAGLGPLLGPNGGPDPDGDLTVAEYQAKHSVTIARAANAEEGADGSGPPPAAAPAPGDGETPPSQPKPAALAALGAKPVVARRTYAGLPVAVENPAGSMRTWTDEGGNSGRTFMRHDYGFIDGHLSGDGEELDCYLGPDEGALYVHVVHQLKAPEFKRHDEDKVMLGFPGAAEAKAAYLIHRDDGERAFGGMSTIPVDVFTAKLQKRKPGSTAKVRASVDAGVAALFVVKRGDGYHVVSETGKNLGGPYATRAEAEDRLQEVERFKHLRRGLMSAVVDMLGAAPRASLARKRVVRSLDGAKRAARYEARMTGKAQDAAAAALAPSLREMLAIVNAADSTKGLKAKLLASFKGRATPAKLQEVMRRVEMMAHLAGRDSALTEG